MDDLVTCRYVGPFPGEMPGPRVVYPGDTVQVTARDAESGWFEPISQPPPPANISTFTASAPAAVSDNEPGEGN